MTKLTIEVSNLEVERLLRFLAERNPNMFEQIAILKSAGWLLETSQADKLRMLVKTSEVKGSLDFLDARIPTAEAPVEKLPAPDADLIRAQED